MRCLRIDWVPLSCAQLQMNWLSNMRKSGHHLHVTAQLAYLTALLVTSSRSKRRIVLAILSLYRPSPRAVEWADLGKLRQLDAAINEGKWYLVGYMNSAIRCSQ